MKSRIFDIYQKELYGKDFTITTTIDIYPYEKLYRISLRIKVSNGKEDLINYIRDFLENKKYLEVESKNNSLIILSKELESENVAYLSELIGLDEAIRYFLENHEENLETIIRIFSNEIKEEIENEKPLTPVNVIEKRGFMHESRLREEIY